jgi:hypothetical protein
MAREAVKLALIRRDIRRTRQFRFSSIQKAAGNSRQQSCDIVPDSSGSVIRFCNVRSPQRPATSKPNHFQQIHLEDLASERSDYARLGRQF